MSGSKELTIAQLSGIVKSVHYDVRLSGKLLAMRCAISSRAGQILAEGQLFIDEDENGGLRLNLRTERGRVIQGGTIDPDGSLTNASKVLFRQFFEIWGMSDLTLTAKIS